MREGEPWLGEEEGLLELDGMRRLHLQLAPGQATFSGPLLARDDLLHPYLAPVGIAFARWLGRETFHSGAFLAAGGAWALVGPNEAGKSSLLAALAARDVPVLSDDLVVIDGCDAFAGPRMLDLRTPLNSPLQGELVVEPARRGTRWRVRLGPVEPAVPFRGWFFLCWSQKVELEPVPASVSLARLARWRGRPQLPSDPAQMLELAALPAWELRRPRRWDALGETVTALIEATRRRPRASRWALGGAGGPIPCDDKARCT